METEDRYVMFKENVVALTFVRLFGLLSMVASGFIIRDIAKKLAHRSGSFLKRVSLTQSILIVLSAADFFCCVHCSVRVILDG